METQKLYYADAYLRRFTARVRTCTPLEAGRWAVTLERTAFYPEGGGQSWDTGTLGAASVLAVRESGGEIVHTVDAPLPVDQVVEGEIDWVRRFDLMQQHSGEHMVSGLICAAYHCDNVGFHISAAPGSVTIDFNAPIPAEDLPALEAAANQKIWENAETEIFYCAGPELEKLEYRSKKALEGAVRIVRFPGSDTCACCGTHVRRTGEVGLVKLLSIQKFRAGVRIEMCAGGRALAWLNTQAAQNHQISVALSAKAEETAAAVGRLQEELFAERGRLSALEQALFSSLARSSAAAAGAPVFVPGLSADSLCRLADAILSENGRAAVFSGDDSAGYRYALGSRDGDIRPLVRELNAALSGRGGGKPGFAQGFLAAKKDGIDAFFAARSGWAFG